MNIDIDKIKHEAVNGTIAFFKNRFSVESVSLLSGLDKEDRYVNSQLKNIEDKIDIDEIADAIKITKEYLENCSSLVFDIQINEGNIIENTPPNIISAQYCLYSYYKAFHKSVIKQLISLEKRDLSISSSTSINLNRNEKHPAKPQLTANTAEVIFAVLEGFFSVEQHNELKSILLTGNNASEKLLFNGNGNRFTDTIKKLFEYDFIIGCEKKDLEKWVIANFDYVYRNTVKEFLPNTVQNIISKNGSPCKNPLIDVINGKIETRVKPNRKNYTKN